LLPKRSFRQFSGNLAVDLGFGGAASGFLGYVKVSGWGAPGGVLRAWRASGAGLAGVGAMVQAG
jgi:hypothetical protein